MITEAGKAVADKIASVFLNEFFKLINSFLNRVLEEFQALVPSGAQGKYVDSRGLLLAIDAVIGMPEFQDKIKRIAKDLQQTVQPLLTGLTQMLRREGKELTDAAYETGRNVGLSGVTGAMDGLEAGVELVPGLGTIISVLNMLQAMLRGGTKITVTTMKFITVLTETVMKTFGETTGPIVKVFGQLNELFEMVDQARQNLDTRMAAAKTRLADTATLGIASKVSKGGRKKKTRRRSRRRRRRSGKSKGRSVKLRK